MPNHVHIIAVPSDEPGLRQCFRIVHRHYTGYINARLRVTEHLWQGRFSSVAMDEAHFATALRYVSHNPVRARLVERPEDWRWSSASAHLAETDTMLCASPLRLIASGISPRLWARRSTKLSYAALRKAESVGRPIGSDAWLHHIEALTGRTPQPQKRGPVPNNR